MMPELNECMMLELNIVNVFIQQTFLFVQLFITVVDSLARLPARRPPHPAVINPINTFCLVTCQILILRLPLQTIFTGTAMTVLYVHRQQVLITCIGVHSYAAY